MRAATAKEKRTNGTGLSVYGVGGEGPAAAASMNWMAKVVVMNRWQGAEAPKNGGQLLSSSRTTTMHI